MGYRLGIDIGGTFTDATLIDENTGKMWIDKVLSTPKDPSVGFMEATHRILRKAQVAPAEVTYLVHSTTVATNSVIEGKVARTGFITTEGFRDMLEIARQIRPVLYDLLFEKPRPLVPRYLCFGVPERLDAHGGVLMPLDEPAVRRVAEKLRQEQVESIAVCLLHSYINPAHEQRVGEILHEIYPQAVVSLSSEVAPEFREYFRASTTVINACIRPVVGRYLQNIEDRLRSEGVPAELLVMQSSGGVLTFETARDKPVFMVESGPAAGVIAATFLGDVAGYRDIISFDMGGTTAKAGLIQNGAPRVTKEYEVGAAARPGTGAAKGSGYPIRTPVIDLLCILQCEQRLDLGRLVGIGELAAAQIGDGPTHLVGGPVQVGGDLRAAGKLLGALGDIAGVLLGEGLRLRKLAEVGDRSRWKNNPIPSSVIPGALPT